MAQSPRGSREDAGQDAEMPGPQPQPAVRPSGGGIWKSAFIARQHPGRGKALHAPVGRRLHRGLQVHPGVRHTLWVPEGGDQDSLIHPLIQASLPTALGAVAAPCCPQRTNPRTPMNTRIPEAQSAL